MESVINQALIAFLFSVILGFGFTPLAIKFAWKYKIIDDPKKHRHEKVIHTYPTPRAGGLALFFAIFIPTLFFLPVDKHIVGIFGGLTILLLMGILDDKYNLSPYPRFLIQFVSATMVVASGIGIAFVTNPFGGTIDLSQPQIIINFLGTTRSIWVLADIFAIVWIVTIINFVNIGAKGVDGQLPGVVAIAAFAIAVLSLKHSADVTQWPVIILALITSGAYLGFLPWNFYPQKIMPAFSGSNIGGFMLAVLSILSTTKIGTLMVILGVPLIDTLYTFLRRIKSGKSPFFGDRGHLHHRLLDSGLNKKQVALFYWAITALLAILALNLDSRSKLYTIIFVILAVGAALSALRKKVV